MKLWDGSDKGRSLIAEKWEKLYEIHFNQGHEKVDENEEEHVVDFEIIHTSLIDGGKSGFTINLAIFTSFNQYLVYETKTTLLAGLKSLSQTKLLYHVHTVECPLSILSTVFHHHHQAEKKNQEVVTLALMAEIDPQRQRKELKKNKEVAA